MTSRSIERQIQDATRTVSPIPDLEVLIPGNLVESDTKEAASYFVSKLIDRLQEALDGQIDFTPEQKLAVVAVAKLAFAEAFHRGEMQFDEMVPGSLEQDVSRVQKTTVVRFPERPAGQDHATVSEHNYRGER